MYTYIYIYETREKPGSHTAGVTRIGLKISAYLNSPT